ncbi:hypothetical protein L2E82_28043 [Cichorium intybus]|uniref:Uncharacterized protein n=1 Tax=Cichorium intybus TaxID=13427 RepID=A0ACB9CUT6_CICIN|nr:hypothetical protein L2E82_28043 [Cichorium intybus]
MPSPSSSDESHRINGFRTIFKSIEALIASISKSKVANRSDFSRLDAVSQIEGWMPAIDSLFVQLEKFTVMADVYFVTGIELAYE